MQSPITVRQRLFITSDHHFGQQNFHEFSTRHNGVMRPQFDTAIEFIDAYIKQYNAIVKPNDVVYFLGDIAINFRTAKYVFRRLNGIKYLVMGNHDVKFGAKHLVASDLFEDIYGNIYLKNKFILTHAPVERSELRSCINLHGHTHKTKIRGLAHYNCCVDYHNTLLVELHKDNTLTRIEMQ